MIATENLHDERPIEATYQRTVPAWLSSLVLHALLVLALAVTIRAVPRGVMPEPDRTTGTVLTHTTDAGE